MLLRRFEHHPWLAGIRIETKDEEFNGKRPKVNDTVKERLGIVQLGLCGRAQRLIVGQRPWRDDLWHEKQVDILLDRVEQRLECNDASLFSSCGNPSDDAKAVSVSSGQIECRRELRQIAQAGGGRYCGARFGIRLQRE